ncbi:hypothetical protein O3P69_011201 [Scylla paramamosain]|uniref:C2H2-type domain-containing protein n=1 Tax=Scylla paramamosain TaxID=85552 RepID=A0AAW0SUP0_SCYPA
MDQFNATSEVDDSSTVASGGTAEGGEAAEGGEEPASANGQPAEGSEVEGDGDSQAAATSGEVLMEEVVEGDVPAKSPMQQVEEPSMPLKTEVVEAEEKEAMKEDTSADKSDGEEEADTDIVKDEEVIMDTSPPTMDGRQVVMEGGEVVTEQAEVMMEGHQVFMEGPVVMEEAPVEMGAEGVLVQGSGLTFDTSMLEGTKGEECASPAGNLVMVKQEDLQDNRYGHNQQILGLVASGVEEEEEVVVGGETQSKILLENLVSEALQSPQRGHDNIIVTTSTITPGQAPTLVRGSPPQATPTRIVVQTNQNTAQKANQGHFLIQSCLVQEPHRDPRRPQPDPSGTPAAVREDPGSPAQQGSIFKVIIPEGTTKVTKVAPAPPAVEQQEPVRKHIQINLSDSTAKRPMRYLSQNASQTTTPAHPKADATGDPKKLYECPTCNSKFMRPLYLRKHMRSCKKEEVKVEKAPLYMCSFCKMTFKTRPQISQHFLKCFHSPYRKKKTQGVKRNNEGEPSVLPKRGRMDDSDIDPLLEQAVQFRCQDCDRTFNKERQYTSHIKRCTKVSVHDLTGPRMEIKGEEEEEEEPESQEDPFADPDPLPPPPKRGRGPGRRGRPPGRGTASYAVARGTSKTSSQLFDGEYPVGTSRGLMVADNEGLVRSTTGLAHTVQLTLETASQEGQPQPSALVADSKGVRGRERPPQAWSLVCALCQKMFITKAALAHHVMAEHGADLVHSRSILEGKIKNNEPLFRCPVCSLNYQSEDQFVEHMVLQHTARLQETFTRLQGETSTYVCSLCSLVLLTKNLLVEHLSLVHLDELEAQARGDTHVEIASRVSGRSKIQPAPVLRDRSAASEGGRKDQDSEGKMDAGEESPLECGFCGEELSNQEEMVEHYIESHGVETDEDGCLLDLGIDVDVRVKDTKGLLQLADGRMDDTVPSKTVLLRKKPRQSWQCKECQQVFSKHFDFPETHAGGGNFKCQEPGCSHLSFYQVKLLFKHMEEVHKIVVPKEFKTFRSLTLFYKWLTGEEQKYNVRYIRDTTRIEKNDMKLIQMVCHRFHTAKIDQSKEKKDGEGETDSPSKKRRWFVRIQRSSNCHARIHLKVQYNPLTQDYDGETQVVYYPQHTHADGDHPQDLMNRIMERHSRSNYLSRNGNRKRLRTGSSPSRAAPASAAGGPGEAGDEDEEEEIEEIPHGEGASVAMDQYMKEFCQTQLEEVGEVDGTALVVTSSGTAHAVLQAGHATQQQQQQQQQHEEQQEEVLLGEEAVFGEGGGQAVLEAEGAGEGQHGEEATEYVLPADEDEWTKLFEVLRLRLMTSELTQQEKEDGEGLLSYQNVISYLPLTQQVNIFQQLCALTNTSIATAD